MSFKSKVNTVYDFLTLSMRGLSAEERSFVETWQGSHQGMFERYVARILLFVFTFSTIGIYLLSPMPQRVVELSTHSALLLLALIWNFTPLIKFNKMSYISVMIGVIFITGAATSVRVTLENPHRDVDLAMTASFFIGTLLLFTANFRLQGARILFSVIFNVILGVWAYGPLKTSGEMYNLLMLIFGYSAFAAGMFYSNAHRSRREILGEFHTRNQLIQSERLRVEAVEQQILLANDIQDCLAPPDKFISPHGVEARFFKRKYHQLGGDWMALRTTGNGDLVFAVADVTGKGVSAALVVHAVQSLWAQAFANPDFDAVDWLHSVNAALLVMGQNKPHTLTMGILVVSKNQIRYFSAGHVPVHVFNGQKSMRTLLGRGNILGVFPDLQLRPISFELDPSQAHLIVMGTDGALDKGSRARSSQIMKLINELHTVGEDAFEQCHSEDDKLIVSIEVPVSEQVEVGLDKAV